MSSKSRRILAFSLLCGTAFAGVVVYGFRSQEHSPSGNAESSAVVFANDKEIAELRRHPYLLFRNTALGSAYGNLSAVALDSPNAARYVTKLPCERVYASSRFRIVSPSFAGCPHHLSRGKL